MGHTNTITLTPDAARPDVLNHLKVGVLVRKSPLPAWLQHLLAQMQQCNFADPILIVDAQKAPESRDSWDHALFRLWRKWDRRFFNNHDGEKLSFDAADDIPEIQISSIQVNSAASVSSADQEKLVSANLDVLLDFVHAGSAPLLAAAARFGTWFFSERDFEQGSKGTYAPALLRSMLESAPTSELSLVARHSADDGLALLSSAYAATDSVSLARAQTAFDWRKPSSIMRALSWLHHSGCDWNAMSAARLPSPPANTAPGNVAMAKFLLRRCARALWSKAQRKLRREQWVIGIRKKGTGQAAGSQQSFTSLAPPPDRFYADPFLIEKDGKDYLFFEELPFANNKGIISCLEVDREGRCSPPRPVLEMDYHLSYPFVFEWRGQMYMLPETRDSGKICLFRAVDFPCDWKLEKILMENVWAVDPTLVEHAGKFWLFAGGVEKHGDINSELYLFFAESPFGPWRPHPLNPVVSDVRRARPAGKLFVHGGSLVRPGQDCSLRYGAAVVLNRIVTLSDTEYREEPLEKLPNGWLPGNLGSHTFNSSEHFEVIDGRRLIRRPFLRTG